MPIRVGLVDGIVLGTRAIVRRDQPVEPVVAVAPVRCLIRDDSASGSKEAEQNRDSAGAAEGEPWPCRRPK